MDILRSMSCISIWKLTPWFHMFILCKDVLLFLSGHMIYTILPNICTILQNIYTMLQKNSSLDMSLEMTFRELYTIWLT